ncbi:MAG: hypothetical protein K6D97_05650 [Clostridia bacterium]|nr:hypothetical protein [Clostridia bacterium]
MKNEKGITLLALIIIVVVLVIIAAISVMVFRNGKEDVGTSEEEFARVSEELQGSEDQYLPDESSTADPEIDIDKELEDYNDTEINEDDKANRIDPDANIIDENV